jgi:hypothetical protein
MVYRLVGFWVLRRAFRILSADDPRPLPKRLTHEARRILLGAAITLALLSGRSSCSCCWSPPFPGNMIGARGTPFARLTAGPGPRGVSQGRRSGRREGVLLASLIAPRSCSSSSG